MGTVLVAGGTVIDRGRRSQVDVLVRDGKIERVAAGIRASADRTIDATGLCVLPGVIDVQRDAVALRVCRGGPADRRVAGQGGRAGEDRPGDAVGAAAGVYQAGGE